MKCIGRLLGDALLLEPSFFPDERGFFSETFNQARFNEVVGRSVMFVQDNHSKSQRGVLRGLHYQIKQPQGKLVRTIAGEVFDVIVDLRKSSPTFGRWASVILSAENRRQLWVPEGFAHGFLALSETAEVLYKTTDYWAPAHERCIAWDDATLHIAWPCEHQPTVSLKDRAGVSFASAHVFE